MKRIRTLTMLATGILAATSHATFIVNTDFESNINTLGAVNGQAANGPNPWTSSGATVVNTGPVLGGQALNYTSTLAPGQFDHHSRVNLATSGGFSFPTGMTLKASVDVYSDPNEPGKLVGLSMWANSHADEHSMFMLEGGFAFAGARHGTGPLAPILGHVSNPPYSGWQTISLLVTQTSANTLTTTYQLNGNPFTYNGAVYNTHVDTIGTQNLVFDFSLVTWNLGQNAEAVTGIYDNYRVEVVPEPTTMVAATFGILGILGRRRRK
jgi:hypothetical protein